MLSPSQPAGATMRLPPLLLSSFLTLAIPALAAEPCQIIHGRANFFGGDGQLRIWHIGTHHEYEPAGGSDKRVLDWLEAGIPLAERDNYATPASAVYLYGDFTICPIEPFRKGAVQKANVLTVTHKHYVRLG